MSAEREAGLTALQNGNAAEAIPYLERAAGNAPNDLETLLPLGTAYGQVGRHADAVRIVMQAVTQQPSNAAARYGLAVAYANAGHQEYALTAAQQAVQLQPDYAQARELIARLSGGSTAAPTTLPGAQPTLQTEAPRSYGEPTQALPSQPTTPAPYGGPASPSPYGQTQMPASSGQPLPGQPASPYAASGGAPYTPQSGAGNYQGQGAAAYGGSPPAAYYTPPARPGYAQPPDKFDMKQALTDWGRVIRTPNAFFEEQAQRQGFNAPLAFLVTFGIVVGIFAIISALIRMMIEPSTVMYAAGQMVGGAMGGVLGALAGAFVWGGILHIIGRMFGNRQPYQKTFRVAAYSRAPLLIFTALAAIITPFALPTSALMPRSSNGSSPFGQVTPVQFTEPTSPSGSSNQGTVSSSDGGTRSRNGGASPVNPFEDPKVQKLITGYGIIGPLWLIGYIWVWCLQGIGLQHAQNISSGAAAGTIFLALFLSFLLLIGVCFVAGFALVALLGSMRGASGFQNMLSLVPSGLAVWRGL